MKLFIIDRPMVEKELGSPNYLTVAHQMCYKELSQSLIDEKIPKHLCCDYSGGYGAVFDFVKYDWERDIYFYKLNCTTYG